METTVQVREATAADVKGMAGAAGRAFADDAVFTWLLGGTEARRARQIAAYYELTAEIASKDGAGLMFTADGTPGTAMWFAPGRWKVSTSTTLRYVPRMLRILGPRALVRALRALSITEKCHPREEHWYLQWLATDPPMQRKGVGSALLQPILERCDAEGLGAYLETQKIENVTYYRRHGFEVTQEIQLGRNGPRGWLMWRDPR
jgi:GNAT superfamily N-acetyltransferase